MTEREKQLLGKYELLSELGRGGMGAVYRAHDPIIGRDVAIKVILDVALSAPGTRERFQREARSAGRLSHENIVTLHDFDEWDGKPYLVMELLAGTDLRQAILDDSLPLAKRLDIALQVAKGLEFAHSQSVIHRDIKPANIMILENGRAKILDFGIARLDSDAGTMTHSSLGTPRYMSPEQIRGEPVDRRSDIFSFGVMLYEMFTGTNPFAADTVPTVVHRILNEDPLPMGQLDPQLDSRLQRLVARCMAKDAAQRISDLAEAIRELETIIADPTPKVEQTRANANADATTVVPRDRKHAPTAAPPAPAAAPAHGVPQAPRAAAPSGNARAAAPAAGAPAPAREPKREPDRSSGSHPAAASVREPRGSETGRPRAIPWLLALAAVAVVAIVVFVWSPWSGGSGGSEPTNVTDARGNAVAAAAALEGADLPVRLASQRARADSLRLAGDRARDERGWNEAEARYRDAAAAYERVARETRDYRADEAHAREASTAMLAARTAIADTASSEFTRARALEADANRALAAEDPARAEHLYREAGGIFSRLAPANSSAPQNTDRPDSVPKSEANGKPIADSRTTSGNDGARSGKKPDPSPTPKNATDGSELADGTTGSGPSSNDSSLRPKGTDPRDTSPAGDPNPAGTEAGATTAHETPASLAPTLSGLVAERFDTVAPALAAAMQTGTWTGLPKPVQSQYQKFYQALTQDHLLRDAKVVGRTLSESPIALEQLVTVTVTQQQKGTDALQDPLDMPMIWTWTLDGGEAIVSAIRPRP